LQRCHASRRGADRNTVVAYKDYLTKHSNGRFASNARKTVDDFDNAAWSKAEGGTIGNLEAYLEVFPNGVHAFEAENSIKRRKEGRPIRFFGNAGKITSIAFSPSGHSALSASEQALLGFNGTVSLLRPFSDILGLLDRLHFHLTGAWRFPVVLTIP
jgi:hypothetical protein